MNMKKPPQELIDAFLKWYESNPHSKNEDYYRETITRNHLSGLSKSDFIDFFYKFAYEGGQVQSGGYRTSGKFRQTIESNYEQFRPFILNPFDTNFGEAKWLAGTKNFKYFGIGLATIYLNRVDKKRFAILNNKAADSLALFAVILPTDIEYDLGVVSTLFTTHPHLSIVLGCVPPAIAYKHSSNLSCAIS